MGYFILINYQSNDEEAEKTLQLVRDQGSDGELLKFDITDAAAALATLSALDGGARRRVHRGID